MARTALVFVGVSTALARGGQEAEPRMMVDRGAVDEVLRIEHEMFEAIARKDVDTLVDLLADDFTYRSPGNPDVGKPEFLRNVAAIPVEIVSIRGEALRADGYGSAVVVTGVQWATTRGADGSEETGAVAFTDVFVLRDGRWRLKLAYGVEPVGSEARWSLTVRPGSSRPARTGSRCAPPRWWRSWGSGCMRRS